MKLDSVRLKEGFASICMSQNMLKNITLNVNGDDYHLAVEPNETLQDLLRERLGLMGTKKDSPVKSRFLAQNCSGGRKSAQ